jgi:hypothetical protein
VFEFWGRIYQTRPEPLAQRKQEIAKREAQLARDETILNARKAISEGVEVLNKMAAAGDENAVAALLEAAYLPGTAVLALEQQQSEMMRRIAGRETVWPVVTDGSPGWEKRAAERLKKLDLGADLDFYRSRLRQPRGADECLPARKWAKAALRTIEDTRFRFMILGDLSKGFESADAIIEFMSEAGWEFQALPDWSKVACELGAFSAKTLPAWKRVTRKMIREQMPNFHERPEWATQRASAIARGRGTPGEIKNAILDDICSALERIAPPAKLRKSAC